MKTDKSKKIEMDANRWLTKLWMQTNYGTLAGDLKDDFITEDRQQMMATTENAINKSRLVNLFASIFSYVCRWC